MLVLKVVLAPLMVTGATLAGRRWGAKVAGIVTATPIVAGPILLILALDHGRDFGAAAARSALLGIVALSVFCTLYARVALHGWSWPRTLAAGWLGYVVVALALANVTVTAGAGLAAALLALAAAYAGIGVGERPAARIHPPPSWDLPARAGATAALVLAITGAAGALGPELSGVLTPFPIATTVLATFTHAQDGPPAVRAMLQGFVKALPGFAAFFFGLAVLL